ncbi:ParB/RepB/Spo0J family partition protein [Deinococcus planocerae]|uniref:ParB/RepB/Spo0J family partition protein n=1 Tax=Deinococcus planocerae TaxID=1737569 RepID=UPI000C7EB381|nr:ParB/RepB/Spo0J family partition protein [Deinococcus planocerae]
MPKTARRSRADAFGSLLGAVEDRSPAVQPVALDRITLRSGQPRRFFGEASLASLAQSVREQGVLQPVLLREVEGEYELIAGERRVRAARLAGLTEIPATVRQVSDEEADLMAALENLQREDLNPLDEVEATLTIVSRQLGIAVGEVLPLLHAQRRAPQPEVVEQLDQVFARLGRSSWRSFASNKAGVLRFPAELLNLMRQGKLEYTRAAALARIKDRQLRETLIQRTLEENLGVREIAAAARPAPAHKDQLDRVRSLLDQRTMARLGEEQRKQVQHLLSELEKVFTGPQGKKARRS